MPGAAIAAVAAQSSPQQQQQQQLTVTATFEELREKSDLQRGFYNMLLAITTHNLIDCLLHIPPQVLDSIMTALAKGAATHVDPSLRRSCIQVSINLDWCCFMLTATLVKLGQTWSNLVNNQHTLELHFVTPEPSFTVTVNKIHQLLPQCACSTCQNVTVCFSKHSLLRFVGYTRTNTMLPLSPHIVTLCMKQVCHPQ